MNEITKPLSLVRHEFIEQLVNDINNCNLPLFVVEPILQDMLNMVRTAAQKQYEQDKLQYEELLKTQKENG